MHALYHIKATANNSLLQLQHSLISYLWTPPR